jgi:hypothetical protein|uniref:DUF2905 domain-containing protein n=1 Tax=candidate division WOR-3 bacterium TaxID=2052148 RepID=A0A7V3PS76_UNCW3
MVTDSLTGVARFLIFTGTILVMLGLGILLFSRLGVFRLPGDIVIERRNLVVYIPIVSSILLSLILSVILSLIFRRQ